MRLWFAVSAGLILLAWCASAAVLLGWAGALPARVPVHWGADGRPDGWLPQESITPFACLLPAVMVGMLALLAALPWLSPQRFEVDWQRGAYGLVTALVQGLLAALHGLILWGMFDDRRGPVMSRLLLVAILVFFIAIGALLNRFGPNFWIGVRTPWTLASPEVWEATHRLAARLYTAGGTGLLVAVLMGLPLMWFVPLFLLLAVYPAVYSLVRYKRTER